MTNILIVMNLNVLKEIVLNSKNVSRSNLLTLINFNAKVIKMDLTQIHFGIIIKIRIKKVKNIAK